MHQVIQMQMAVYQSVWAALVIQGQRKEYSQERHPTFKGSNSSFLAYFKESSDFFEENFWNHHLEITVHIKWKLDSFKGVW